VLFVGVRCNICIVPTACISGYQPRWCWQLLHICQTVWRYILEDFDLHLLC